MQRRKLNVKKEIYNGIDSIKIIGPFDLIDNQIDLIVDEILSMDKKSIVFDFGETSFIASSGLAAMFKALRKLQNINGTLYVTNATQDMYEFLSLSSLDKFIQYL